MIWFYEEEKQHFEISYILYILVEELRNQENPTSCKFGVEVTEIKFENKKEWEIVFEREILYKYILLLHSIYSVLFF